ncbi:MAG TPA: response regulator, partial [Thermoanaerobaculia bacterium]|nr:response regulator [Thermoanaerobaculia bacterium]
ETNNTGQRKVLIADDEQNIVISIEFLMKREGFQVLIAHDGEEALAKTGRHRPEVVLLDIGLPKMDGYEVARRLRLDSGNEGLLLIAVTGYGNREDRERGKLSGFDYHLVKPIDLQQLQRLLASQQRNLGSAP